MILLLNLADKLGIDPLEAAAGKLRNNGAEYPADEADRQAGALKLSAGNADGRGATEGPQPELRAGV